MTGLAAKFSHLIFYMTDASLFSSLLAAAVLTLILGLGMPTPSAYIIAAVSGRPIACGRTRCPFDGRAHVLAVVRGALAMTPPVAVAAYTASAIAGGNPLAIAVTTMRLSIGAFVLPFAFMFSHELLLIGEPVFFHSVCRTWAEKIRRIARNVSVPLRRLVNAPWCSF